MTDNDNSPLGDMAGIVTAERDMPKRKNLKAFRPLPPLRADEITTLDSADVKRINDTFVNYVGMLDNLQKRADLANDLINEIVEALGIIGRQYSETLSALLDEDYQMKVALNGKQARNIQALRARARQFQDSQSRGEQNGLV